MQSYFVTLPQTMANKCKDCMQLLERSSMRWCYMKMPDLPRLPARQRKEKPCIALVTEALVDNQVSLTRLIS